MLRGLVIAALCLAVTHQASGQTPGTLHIKVTLVDAEQRPIPVARHALLISDNPSTTTPRRVVTGTDGTVDVRLRGGNYTVESDEPLALLGRRYQWTETLDVPGGSDTILELTVANAEVGTLTPSTTPVETSAVASPPPVDPVLQLSRWRDSIVGLWTPVSHASGFLVDARGFVLTNQRAIGDAGMVEVQLSAALKVEGRVVASDAARDMAVVWIDPSVMSSAEPVSLACGTPGDAVAEGAEIVALGVSLRGEPDMVSGDVNRVGATEIVFGSRLQPGSAGGPAFSEDGHLVGLTSPWDEKSGSRPRESRVVPIAGACDVVSLAAQKTAGAAPPAGRHLPVEPTRPFPETLLKELAERRTGTVAAYQLSASDFEVSFVTPLMVYAARQPARRTTSKDTRVAPSTQMPQRSPTDFGAWSEYFADYPPVLVVRVTPKMAESFWATVARGAAMTQGMSLPAMKRVKTGFSRIRAFCGDAELTAIHPFVVESAFGGNSAVEGLYVFEPDAIGPHCATVKLTLYSVKEPDRGDTRTVDPALVKQIWQDFEPYRQQ